MTLMNDVSPYRADAVEERLCKLLIVDDEESIRKFIKGIVKAHSLPVDIEEAPDGEEGLSLYKRYSPDIVITDVCMPKMDGIELLGRIRKLSRETEVIMITGFAETQMVVEALRAGATNFIEKPFTAAAMAEEIKNSVARWEAKFKAVKLQNELDRQLLLREQNGRMATAGRLAAGLADEVNNPLTYLKANAELVAELVKRETEAFSRKAVVEEINALLSDIAKGAEAIEERLGVMRRFLSASSIFENISVPLSSLMSDAARLSMGRKPSNVEFAVALPPREVMVNVHTLEMESCLVNLLVNGYEAIQPKGGTVSLTAATVNSDEDRGWVEVTVQSTPNEPIIPTEMNNDPYAGGHNFWHLVALKAAERNKAQLDIMLDENQSMKAVLRLHWTSEG